MPRFGFSLYATRIGSQSTVSTAHKGWLSVATPNHRLHRTLNQRRCACWLRAGEAGRWASHVHMFNRFIVLFTSISLQGALAADTAPSNRVVCAIEAPICARANIERNETVIERSYRETRTREQLWSVPSWLNIVRIDESGSHLLVETTSFGMLPPDATEDFVVLRIFNRGAPQREIKLKEIIPEPAAQRTAANVGAWGMRLGSPNSGVAMYILASGRRLKVDLESGRTFAE